MRTAVLYLTRDRWTDLKGFLESHQRFDAGHDHELIIVRKGRRAPRANPLHRRRELEVSDFGRSLYALRKAIVKLSSEFDMFVILNSFSRIACDDWLARLVAVASRPEVGAAGCSASLESFLGNKPALWRILAFPAWPNPHLRTNAIAMRTEVALKFWPGFTWNKPLEHIAESGWWGLTNRLRAANLKCVVVGKTSEHEIQAHWDRLDAPCFKPEWQPMVTDNRICA